MRRTGAFARIRMESFGKEEEKIEWTSKRNPESPYFVMVPGTLKFVSLIEKAPWMPKSRHRRRIEFW
jgi:hypothetical protein